MLLRMDGMADIVTKEQRSYMMSRIRGKDTKPEIVFRKMLHARGYRYSLHPSRVPGHPDLYLRKYRTAVFVHGCFFHRHGCGRARPPKSNLDYWIPKLARNVERDAEILDKCEAMRIRTIVAWECSVNRMARDEAFRDEILDRIGVFLRGASGAMQLEI